MVKTVLPSKFQEWRGLDRINHVVHEMRCIFRELSKDDFGIDGEIEVVVPKEDGKGYRTTGGIIKVQAKSGKSYIRQNSAKKFKVAVDKNDLEFWYNATFPVIFVVYHPDDDKLYWKEIKSYVRSSPNVFKPPLTIDFEKATDEFTVACYDSICQIASVSPPRVSTQERERLYSNLLLIKQLPKVIFHAPTQYKMTEQIREEIEGFVPPFCIHAGHLYTFSDLQDSRCTLRKFCDTHYINELPADQWFQDEGDRKNYTFLLNQLLGIHLRRCGLRYNPHFRRNYFSRQNKTDTVFRQNWFNLRTGRSAPARIVAKFYQYGNNKFWRHLAVNLSFKPIGSSWFLQIIPKYFFTTDGETPWDSYKVGPYTTRIKANEHNIQVLNHIFFWADILSQQQPTIELKLDYKTLMVIEKEPLSGIANFAIPNDPAVYEELQDVGQLSLLDELFIGSQEDSNDEY